MKTKRSGRKRSRTIETSGEGVVEVDHLNQSGVVGGRVRNLDQNSARIGARAIGKLADYHVVGTLRNEETFKTDWQSANQWRRSSDVEGAR